MSEIVIKQADMDFLLGLLAKQAWNVDRHADLLRRFHPRSTHPRNTLFANFNDMELELLIDALGDVFISSGLKDNDEPNELGLRVESYIDIFNKPNPR